MPVIMFTLGEIADSAIRAARETSDEILKLADVQVTPLNPGESVNDRYHKIAKLGKQLAMAFHALDEVMKTQAEQHAAMHGHMSTPDKDSDDDGKAN